MGLLGAGVVAGCAASEEPAAVVDHHGFSQVSPKTADEALKRLVAGNECYISEHFKLGDARAPRRDVWRWPRRSNLMRSC